RTASRWTCRRSATRRRASGATTASRSATATRWARSGSRSRSSRRPSRTSSAARRGPPWLRATRRSHRRPEEAPEDEIMSNPFKPIDGFKSARFSQIATFMRLPHHRTASDLDVAILGIPYDGGTSYRAGARFGPREIRSQSAMIRPWNPVLKVSPYEALKIADYGDLDISPVSIERTNQIVEEEIAAILAAGCMPVSVGGDHSIALPILRALARRHGPVALVHFDSHPDTWDTYF